jgi:nucleoside-diphosphate-sugar epimerase
MNNSYSAAIVTGASGFIGRHLVQQLLVKGVHVLAGDCVPWPRESHPNLTFQQVDIGSPSDLETFYKPLQGLEGHQITVFHMAGQAHSGYCSQNPTKSVTLNVLTPLNIVEVCRDHGIRDFIFPSTGLVYGAHGLAPYKESDSVNPVSLYAASKLAAENLLQAYSKEFGLRCRIARLSNVYGYGASEDTITSLLLAQVIKRQDIKLKTLKPIRDFIYVEDVVDSLIALSQIKGESSFEIYNVGTGQPTSIDQLAHLICRIADRLPHFSKTDSNSSEEDSQVLLNIDKLVKATGWSPSWTLSNGIQKTLKLMAGN